MLLVAAIDGCAAVCGKSAQSLPLGNKQATVRQFHENCGIFCHLYDVLLRDRTQGSERVEAVLLDGAKVAAEVDRDEPFLHGGASRRSRSKHGLLSDGRQ